MNYDLLSKLDEQQQYTGIKAYYLNSLELKNIGISLAQQKKFGLATSVVILSIEELIKAFSVFLVYVGETNPNIINPTFNAKNVHQSRLKLASAYNFAFGFIDQSRLKKTLNQKKKALSNVEAPSFKNTKELMNWVEIQLDILVNSVNQNELGMPLISEIELNNKFKGYTDWYSKAQKIKEKGFYTDYINNKWHIPQNMTKKDYDEALKYSKITFETIGKPIKKIIETDELRRKVLKLSIMKISEHFKPQSL